MPPTIRLSQEDDFSERSAMSACIDQVRNVPSSSVLTGKSGSSRQFVVKRDRGKSAKNATHQGSGLKLPALRSRSCVEFPDLPSPGGKPLKHSVSLPVIGIPTRRNIPLRAYDDDMVQRMVSLPLVMCRGANGDLMQIELDDVAKKIHRQRLNPNDLEVLKRFENSLTTGFSQWDLHKPVRHEHKFKLARVEENPMLSLDEPLPDTEEQTPKPMRQNSMMGRSPAGAPHAPLARSMSKHTRLAPMKSINEIDRLDSTLRARLDKTMGAVESRRAELHEEQMAKIREAQEGERLKDEEVKKHVDYTVDEIIPNLFMNMVSGVKALGKNKNTAVEKVNVQQIPEKSGGFSWSRLSKVLQDKRRRVDNLPYMDDWKKATKKLDKGGEMLEVGWNGLYKSKTDVYAKGGDDSQGAAAYRLQCQSLGISASSQVMSQLQREVANMSHCKLGKFGATALRHALAANTIICNLNLEDNGLCFKAISEIIEGLSTGGEIREQAAHMAAVNRWQRAEALSLTALAPDKKEVDFLPKMLRQSMTVSKTGTGETNDASARKPDSAGPPEVPEEVKEKKEDVEGAESDGKEGSKEKVEAAEEEALSQPRPPRKPQPPLIRPTLDVQKHVVISTRVKVLDLSDNPIGLKGAKLIAAMLDPAINKTQALTELRINKCGISDAGGVALGQALLNGNKVLQVLYLSNNALGWRTASTFGELLKYNTGLTFLDLSWNSIKPDDVTSLCEGLEENGTLGTLNLSWNGLEEGGGITLGGVLKTNSRLRHLDLSNCRLGPQAALVLADGLRYNSTLEVLLMNGNMVADEGARNLIAALKTNTTLKYLGLQGSNMSNVATDNDSLSHFNPLCPDGSYALDLSKPAERAVALQLVILEVESPNRLLRNVKYEGRNVSNPEEHNWPEELPHKGLLQADFDRQRERKVLDVLPARKFSAMHAQIETGSICDKEKLQLIKLMAPFSLFTCRQSATILGMMGVGSERVAAALLLFTRCADLHTERHQLLEALSGRECEDFRSGLRWFLDINFSNPTGHYELSLITDIEHQLAMRLKDVAYQEPMTSHDNWVNIIYDKYTSTLKVPGSFGPPPAWKEDLPKTGFLIFDYVSSTTPPSGAKPLTDTQLRAFLVEKVGMTFSEEDGLPLTPSSFQAADALIQALRREASPEAGFFTTCDQVVQVVNCFEAGPHRVEVVVILYTSIVDRMARFWVVLQALSLFEQGLARFRLGPLNTVDQNHFSGHYILDLSLPSHELTLKKLVDYSSDADYITLHNLRVGGRLMHATVMHIMGLIQATSSTPFVELDIIGPEALKRYTEGRENDEKSMSKADKNAAAGKIAVRMKLDRIRELYTYYDDGSEYPNAGWNSRVGLMKALHSKQPWLAAWDRLCRRMVRYDEFSGTISSNSSLEDIFEEFCNSSHLMSRALFESCLKRWGASKAEIKEHYLPLFDMSAEVPAGSPDQQLQRAQLLNDLNSPVAQLGLSSEGSAAALPLPPSPAQPCPPSPSINFSAATATDKAGGAQRLSQSDSASSAARLGPRHVSLSGAEAVAAPQRLSVAGNGKEGDAGGPTNRKPYGGGDPRQRQSVSDLPDLSLQPQDPMLNFKQFVHVIMQVPGSNLE